jgi:glycine oxidase
VVGTTLEDVGFTRGVTAAGMDHVLEVAQSLVRGLATAPLVRHWSSFRPSTPDGRPIVGKIGGIWVATGHHRNGILLSAHTAELLAAAMCEAVALPALWSPQRFEGVPA